MADFIAFLATSLTPPCHFATHTHAYTVSSQHRLSQALTLIGDAKGPDDGDLFQGRVVKPLVRRP